MQNQIEIEFSTHAIHPPCKDLTENMGRTNEEQTDWKHSRETRR